MLPRSNLAFGIYDVSDDDDDDETVASLSCLAAETDDDEENEDERVFDNLDTPIAQCYDEEQLFGFGNGFKPKGLVNENLTIQVPNVEYKTSNYVSSYTHHDSRPKKHYLDLPI